MSDVRSLILKRRSARPGVIRMAVLIAVSCISSRGFPAADESVQRAKALYDEGVTDYNLGQYDKALASFEQAYRVRHDPAFLFNIGQCQRQLHRPDEAERSFRAYLRESTEVTESMRQQIQSLITEMQSASEEARAKANATQVPSPNGVQPARAAQPSPTNQRPGIWTRTASDDRAGRTKMLAGIGVAAFGVAAIACGGGFYAAASSANDQLNHPSNGVYSQSAEDQRDRFQSLDIAAFVLGGVALVTGATVGLLGWRQRRRLTLVPDANASHVGATLNGVF